jgi:hypothetical protein
MRKSNVVLASLSILLAAGFSTGTGLANAAPSAGPPKAIQAVSAACTAATQQVSFIQVRITEASATRNDFANQVAAQKTARNTAITAGQVEAVSKLNLQLGSSTALYNTMDSSVTYAQAQLVRAQAAKNAAC